MIVERELKVDWIIMIGMWLGGFLVGGGLALMWCGK